MPSAVRPFLAGRVFRPECEASLPTEGASVRISRDVAEGARRSRGCWSYAHCGLAHRVSGTVDAAVSECDKPQRRSTF